MASRSLRPNPASQSARRARAGALAISFATHAIGGIAAIGAIGCNDLDRFSTGPDEAYCGSITLGSAFRTGLSPRVQMRLRLDATALDGDGSPGTLSTYEGPDATHPERRLLDEAPLRPIHGLSHDPLSQLEFGDGRERNAIFAVSPAEAEAEGLLAVISLRADGSVEVRLIRPGVEPTGDEPPPSTRLPIFGLFPLTRQPGTCGF